MSDKTTRRGIYMTESQWAVARGLGDGNYSAGVRQLLKDDDDLAETRRSRDRMASHASVLQSLCDAYKSELSDIRGARDKCIKERDATIDANGELVLDVDNLTVERDTLQAEYDTLNHKNVKLELELEALAAVPSYRVRGRWLAIDWLAFLVVSALALAVLEGIDKAWWGWTL